MKTVEDIHFVEGLPVLVRAGLNVPLENGKPTSTFRLRRAIKTIHFLQKQKAKVIVISHVGRDPFATLRPVYESLRTEIPRIAFSDHVCGSQVRDRIQVMMPGDVLVLENLRRNTGEIQNDQAFVRELASLADVFVQDAFDTCHRKHASIIGVPQFLPSYAGLLVEEEVSALQGALKPKKPSLAIIGGAKFSTKAPLIEKLMRTYDRVFVGGALGNDLLMARGYPVGQSIVSGKTHLLEEIARDARVIGPVDVVVSSVEGGGERGLHDVKEKDMILDAGPKTVSMLAEYANDARTILWNGPLGYYEKGFAEGTLDLAQAIAKTNAHTIIGGGDTVASIESLELEHDFSFISTGGGAMLDYLTHGTLPGLEPLE